jgi:hypothetical protein
MMRHKQLNNANSGKGFSNPSYVHSIQNKPIEHFLIDMVCDLTLSKCISLKF